MGLCRNGPDLLARILRHAMVPAFEIARKFLISLHLIHLLATRLRSGLKGGRLLVYRDLEVLIQPLLRLGLGGVSTIRRREIELILRWIPRVLLLLGDEGKNSVNNHAGTSDRFAVSAVMYLV
jgi:hypothetical protein